VRTDTKNEQQKRLSWSAPRIYLFCKRDKNWRLKKKGEKKGGAVCNHRPDERGICASKNKEAIDLESEKLTTITHNDRRQCQKQPRRPLWGLQ
jgi:hypothetical protein